MAASHVPVEPHAGLPAIVAGLLDPAAYAHPTAPIRLIETHISWVLLTGAFAYKVKKPVDLGFLDFTTLERRRHFCLEEVRLCGRFAPALYVGVVPIAGTPAAPRVGGAGEPIEWAVQLVEFGADCRLDRRLAAGLVGPQDCRRLAADLAAVHATLPVADPAGGRGTAAAVHAAASLNLDQIVALRPAAADLVAGLRAWLTARLTSLHVAVEDRRRRGRVRECHGDLHLANIVLSDDRLQAFDALEFDPALRWIDVANDIAFLTMDLRASGRPDLAAHVASAWIEAADDHDAARLLPVYETYRAVVRAAVATIRGHQADAATAVAARAEADVYLETARAATAAPEPVLVATSGVSGSGKTTVTDGLVGELGAVRLRSDVERKRLFGLPALARPSDAAAWLYAAETTRAVYDRLATLAGLLLRGGTTVIVDAACTARWQRDLLARVARQHGRRLVWLDFTVPADVAMRRVADRQASGHDASDASVEVVRAQLASLEPITADELSADVRRLELPEHAGPGLAERVRAGVAPTR
jgi:aminoglycoside phosphotransferase family enzyme/predicted kinase